MGWIYGRAQEKLRAYRLEATLRQQLPAGVWRGRVAQGLRNVAERLEPVPAPAAP